MCAFLCSSVLVVLLHHPTSEVQLRIQEVFKEFDGPPFPIQNIDFIAEKYLSMYVCIHARMHTYIHTYMYVCVCVYVCMYVCMCFCMYV